MIRNIARAALVSIAVVFAPCSVLAQGFHSVFTPDGLAVWAAGDSSAIYLSTDAGVSYQRLTAGTNPLYGIASNGFTVLAVGAGGRVYRSTNSGGTWTTQDLVGTPDLRGIEYPGPGAVYAVGATGTIRKSTDGGATWVTQISGVATTLRAVSFIDEQSGYVVGDAGTVLRTTNGGENWNAIAIPTTNDLLALDYTDATVWVGGALGTCLWTQNHGANWTHVNLKLDARSDVRAVQANSFAEVYLAGGGGFVRRTINAGDTWTFQKHQMLGRATGLARFGNRLYLCSDRHRVVFRTADGGNVWGMPPLASFSRTFVQKLEVSFGTTIRGNTIALNPKNPRSLFALLGAQVYKSLNEGESWFTVGTLVPSATRANAFIVSPKDTNLWVAAVAGLEGQIVRSTNAGATWTAPLTMTYGEYGVPLEMHPDRPDTLYFGPSNARLWRSIDFGANWAQWSTDEPFRSPCDLIVVPDSSEIILVGDGTTNSTNPPAQVYKSIDAGETFDLMYSGPGAQDASEMPGMACSRLANHVAIGTQWAGGGTVRSTNFGSNWSVVQPSPQAWGIDIAKDDPGLVMFGQYSGQTFFMSTDGGATWQGASTVSGSNYGLYARDRELILTTQSQAVAGPGIWKLKPTYSYTPVTTQYVNVNSPNGSESWIGGSVRSVTWSHQSIAIARIEYRKSQADPWQLVAEVPGYHGGYDWVVPHDGTYEAEVRISDAWDGSPSDVSDLPFTIVAPVVSIFPNPVNLGVAIPGLSVERTMYIDNPGTSTLSVTSVTSSSPEFSVSRTAFSVEVGETDTIRVFYHPTSAGPDTATLTLVASVLPIPTVVTVTGRGTENTDVPGGGPAAFALHQNSPNPFGGRTLIRYALPTASDVTLEIFDLRGRLVATLVRERQEAGEHSAAFGGARNAGAAAGVYFYRLKAGSFAATRKMLYVR